MRTLLTADWTDLLVANFETDPAFLKPYLPAHTELNEWNGHYYLTLVGFMFSRPTFAGIPAPFYRSFEEVNLRFYVRRKTKEGWRKGVVFIQEIAASPIVGLTARLLYSETFIACPMSHRCCIDDRCRHCSYHWKKNGNWNFLSLDASLCPIPASPDSMQSFIRDHFYAYGTGRLGCSREFQISHEPWNIFSALSFRMQLDARAVYGEKFVTYFQEPPVCSFLMDGSRTKVSFPLLFN